jgi:two-component system, NtrC family, response regulator HydG
MTEKTRLSASSRHSILIVDDNQALALSTALILEYKGYTVATAAHGLEAIAMVEENPFDMIFMDIKMPLMDGVETHRRIKAIRPDAVVMMMTAYAVEDLIQQALDDGAYGILYKPVDIDKILAIIAKAQEEKKGALIMVVDDDDATCTSLMNILTRKCYRVGIAHTGEEAITTARETAYDILLIDMKLPALNGLETYLSIREIDPNVVAIMTTAYRQEMADLVETALRNQAYTCLYKPIDIEAMLQIIAEICERKKNNDRD